MNILNKWKKEKKAGRKERTWKEPIDLIDQFR
jgi:hypothetical protein